MISPLRSSDPVNKQTRWRQVLRLAAGLVITLNLIGLPDGFARAQEALADPVVPLPPVVETGGHLGICYANYSERLTTLASQAGARYDRVDFAWYRIEPWQGGYGFDAYRNLVDQDEKYGLSTVGILMGTPDWAANCSHVSAAVARSAGLPNAPFLMLPQSAIPTISKCPPKGLYLDWRDSGNVWSQFVQTTVGHFPEIDVWEIWNEPDLWDWFWTGSVADYAQLLKVGYQAVKAANPDATVLFSGLAYWANPDYYIAVLDALAAMPDAGSHNNYYFDAMSLHLYSSVYTIRTVVTKMQAAMTARVGAHPIWITEAGVPLWDEAPGSPGDTLNRATAEEAAAYAIQAFATARSAGVEKLFFFRTHDDGMHTGPFGLIRDDGTLRPAYTAYQVAATYLHGENQVTYPGVTPEGIQRITFWGTPRGRIDVLWNITGTGVTYDYPALLPEVTVVDKRGVTTTLPNTGTVPLHLEPATANTGEEGSLLIGGAPLLVIQADTVPPTSNLNALPATWYGKALTVTLTVADNAGPGRPGSGLWYSEIERAPAAAGPWVLAVGWPQTQHTTTVAVPIPSSGTWYFRARARDGAGNWEAWPTGAEAQAMVITTRTVNLAVTSYSDVNSSGGQDPGEGSAASTTLNWTTTGGVPVSQHAGANWTTTATVEEGNYVITARAPGHLPAFHHFTVTAGPETIHVGVSLGLKPIRASVYMPLLFRQY